MVGIPRRYSHVAFGVIQSWLTTGVAAAIATLPFFPDKFFFVQWLRSWFLAWILMLPFVVFAAPLIRRLVDLITHEAHR